MMNGKVKQNLICKA